MTKLLITPKEGPRKVAERARIRAPACEPEAKPLNAWRARYALRASRRRGGVATQRPAKPSTPVRFRSSPLMRNACSEVLLAGMLYLANPGARLGFRPREVPIVLKL